MFPDLTVGKPAVAVLAQAFGIIAMILNVSSFQAKTKGQIILVQLLSSSFYALNLLFLGAPMGFFLNTIGVLRAIVCHFENFFHAEKKFWLIFFPSLAIVLYVLTFTVFGTEPTAERFILEFLPVLGIVATTIGFFRPSAKELRILSLINSPVWLIYHAAAGSIGGSLGEIVVMTSIVVGMLRHDVKRKK